MNLKIVRMVISMDKKTITENIRINKYLSSAGICSRREADRLIEEKRVLVDGKPAVQGMQVEDFQEIKVDGKAIKREEKKVLLVFHKPKGIECTANPNVKKM